MTGLSRRTALALLASSAASPLFTPAFAKGVDDRKFVFVVLRGAMDGLAALIPDDKQNEALRGSIIPAAAERLDLGNGFRLHPALTGFKQLYDTREMAFIHAAATPYRERSHFDGQDMLETLSASGTRDGWLNRALQVGGLQGLSVSHAIPLALKGEGRASNWSPPVFDAASDDLLDRLSDLYADDPTFAAPLATARSMQVPGIDMADTQSGRGPQIEQARASFAALGEFMAAEGGPGIGMLSLDGWDTHANQKAALQRQLMMLDAGIAALKTALGTKWAQTAIVMCSEFGRTARANGTSGSDHGTGGLVILAGGAISGGQVYGDWPGLSDKALYQNRDLAPANDIAGALKGVLRDHLGIDRSRLDNFVLPSSGRAVDGLIRT